MPIRYKAAGKFGCAYRSGHRASGGVVVAARRRMAQAGEGGNRCPESREVRETLA